MARSDKGVGKETQVYLPTLPPHALEHPPEGVGEDVWIDVIRKMDEVYSDLLQYE
ncbi:MAG: PAS domain-containing sensor histidine kinase, partial [Rhodocyclaceae bacterium]|nr:PAS domain-containing sensor histidine kinase [Rhodocyclaceae bacterium]